MRPVFRLDRILTLATWMALASAGMGLVSLPVWACGPTGAPAYTGSQDDYNYGKRVFFRKLVNPDGLYAGRGADAEDAKLILKDLETGTGPAASLSESDRKAAAHYIKLRFNP